MRAALDGLLGECKLDAGNLREALAVAPNDRAPGSDALLQPLQAAEPEGRVGLVQAVVEADIDHVVGRVVAAMALPGAAREGVRAQQPHALGALLIAGRHHAALADAQLLLGEEAEGAELADRAGLAAGVVHARSDRLGAVLDQGEPVLVAEGAQGEHVGRIAAEVHGHDRLRSGRDPARCVLGVDVEVLRAAHVAEHGLGADVARGTGAGHERERRHDHLVPRTDPRCQAGEVQGGGPAGDRDGVGCAHPVGERRLERLRARPHRQPPGLQAVEHRPHILLGHRDVGQRHAPVVHGASASASAAATRSWSSWVMCG